MDAAELDNQSSAPLLDGKAESVAKGAADTVKNIRGSRFFSKAGQIFETVCGYIPITNLGIVYALLLLLTYVNLARAKSDLVWITGSITLSLIEGLMIAAVIIGTISLRFAWKKFFEQSGLSAISGECGFQTETGLALKIWPIPFIEIDIKWLDPPQIEVVCKHDFFELREYIKPKQRCSVETVKRRITVKDILGLASLSWNDEQQVKVKIFPAKGSMKDTTVTFSMSGGEDISDPFGSPEGDLIEMRKYVPGDSSRSILWKVFARSRKLVVRMPERALTAKPRTCAYLVAGDEDENSASMAKYMLQGNLLGNNWCFGADNCSGTTETLSGAMDFLASSGNRPVKGCNLASFLNDANKRGYHNCFVFIPASVGPWLNDAKRAAQNTHLQITWVMGFNFNMEEAEQPRKKWERYVFMDNPEQKAPPSQVVEKLHTEHTPLVLCEINTGAVIDNAAAYLNAHRKALQ